MPNPENLRPPWKPGQSGNPAGKAPGTVSLLSILKRKLAENDGADAEAIIDALIRDAKKADGQSRKLALAYIDGNPKENGGASGEARVTIVNDVPLPDPEPEDGPDDAD